MGPIKTHALVVDACALLPVDEFKLIVGGEAVDVRSTPHATWAAGQCALSGSSFSILLTVATAESLRASGSVRVRDISGKLDEFEQRSVVAGPTSTVAGIGDRAIIGPAGIAVVAGDVYVEVMNLRSTEDQLIEFVRLAIKYL